MCSGSTDQRECALSQKAAAEPAEPAKRAGQHLASAHFIQHLFWRIFCCCIDTQFTNEIKRKH